jgi:hypothetical protein
MLNACREIDQFYSDFQLTALVDIDRAMEQTDVKDPPRKAYLNRETCETKRESSWPLFFPHTMRTCESHGLCSRMDDHSRHYLDLAEPTVDEENGNGENWTLV